jgi:hypothetical protein
MPVPDQVRDDISGIQNLFNERIDVYRIVFRQVMVAIWTVSVLPNVKEGGFDEKIQY